jgi:hypothetical protein
MFRLNNRLQPGFDVVTETTTDKPPMPLLKIPEDLKRGVLVGVLRNSYSRNAKQPAGAEPKKQSNQKNLLERNRRSRATKKTCWRGTEEAEQPKKPAGAEPKKPSNQNNLLERNRRSRATIRRRPIRSRNHLSGKVCYTHSVVTHGWTKHTRFIDHETAVK